MPSFRCSNWCSKPTVAILRLRTCHAMIPASGYLYPYSDQPFALNIHEQTDTMLSTEQPKQFDL